MVDRITESNAQALDNIKDQLKANSAQSADKLQPAAPIDVKPVGFTAEDTAAAKATISPEALNKAKADLEVLRFSRSAGRISDAGEQPDKVSTLKALFDSGNTESYLSQIDFGGLADSLLNSPAGAYLKKVAA